MNTKSQDQTLEARIKQLESDSEALTQCNWFLATSLAALIQQQARSGQIMTECADLQQEALRFVGESFRKSLQANPGWTEAAANWSIGIAEVEQSYNRKRAVRTDEMVRRMLKGFEHLQRRTLVRHELAWMAAAERSCVELA